MKKSTPAVVMVEHDPDFVWDMNQTECWKHQLKTGERCEQHALPDPLPNPGSREAMEIGCFCSPTANAAGRDKILVTGTPATEHYAGTPDYEINRTEWHIRDGCPVHDPKALDAPSAQETVVATREMKSICVVLNCPRCGTDLTPVNVGVPVDGGTSINAVLACSSRWCRLEIGFHVQLIPMGIYKDDGTSHGNKLAYNRHRRLGEPLCEPCLEYSHRNYALKKELADAAT